MHLDLPVDLPEGWWLPGGSRTGLKFEIGSLLLVTGEHFASCSCGHPSPDSKGNVVADETHATVGKAAIDSPGEETASSVPAAAVTHAIRDRTIRRQIGIEAGSCQVWLNPTATAGTPPTGSINTFRFVQRWVEALGCIGWYSSNGTVGRVTSRTTRPGSSHVLTSTQNGLRQHQGVGSPIRNVSQFRA